MAKIPIDSIMSGIIQSYNNDYDTLDELPMIFKKIWRMQTRNNWNNWNNKH
jgi:hypothetical protein